MWYVEVSIYFDGAWQHKGKYKFDTLDDALDFSDEHEDNDTMTEIHFCFIDW